MRAYTVPVKTPDGLDALINLSVLADNRPFDLTGATVALEIWDTRSDDQLLYSATEADPVITVTDTVVVDIPADTAVYEDLEVYIYRYGMNIIHPALSFRVQGTWQILRSYGPEVDNSTQWVVSVTDSSLTVLTGGIGPTGAQGVKGDTGPSGPWSSTVRTVTSTGPILTTNQTVLVMIGNIDATFALPDPSDLYDTDNDTSLTLHLYRPANDGSGVATLSGQAPNLPDEFYPDESLDIRSDGTNLIVSW